VPHIRANVHGGRGGLKGFEEVTKRERRATILAYHDGGDALAEHRQCIQALEKAPIVVTVGVDETRRQHEAGRVEALLSFQWRQIANLSNDPVLDADVRYDSVRARTVEHESRLDQDAGSGLRGLLVPSAPGEKKAGEEERTKS
jgi:hypothetical protein